MLLTLGKRCENAQEEQDFRHAFKLRWKPLALEGFLAQDVRARESAQQFYQHDIAWFEEGLVEDDFMLIEWRKLSAKHNRGLQSYDHLV